MHWPETKQRSTCKGMYRGTNLPQTAHSAMSENKKLTS